MDLNKFTEYIDAYKEHQRSTKPLDTETVDLQSQHQKCAEGEDSRKSPRESQWIKAPILKDHETKPKPGNSRLLSTALSHPYVEEMSPSIREGGVIAGSFFMINPEREA